MKIVILVLMFICLPINAVANVVAGCTENFSWLPNDEREVLGYRIYYGTTNLGPYPMLSEIYNPGPKDGRIFASVSGLECGTRYYFVCVAYNDYGESVNSIQVTVIAGKRPFKLSLFMPAIINGRNN
jgi:hypothetical protein